MKNEILNNNSNLVKEIINRITSEIIEIDNLNEEQQQYLTKTEAERYFFKNCSYGNDTFTLMINMEDLIPTNLLEEWKKNYDKEDSYVPIYDWFHNIKNAVYDALKEHYNEYSEYKYLDLNFGNYEGWSLIIDEKDSAISRYSDE